MTEGPDSLLLTRTQLATLAYVGMKCAIETYGRKSGSRALKALAKVGLLRVYEEGKGRRAMRSWSLTVRGRKHLAANQEAAQRAMARKGWL